MTRAEMIAAYMGGKSIGTVAREAGVANATVWRALKAAGVERRRQGPRLLPSILTLPTDPATIGYIAGLFDGEGNLYWRRRTDKANSIRVTIYSTNAEVIEWLGTTLGGFMRWDHLRTAKHGWKPIGRWEINRRHDAIALLRLLLPHLIIKRDLAKNALADLARWPEPGPQIHGA